jgi:hypothetical protein
MAPIYGPSEKRSDRLDQARHPVVNNAWSMMRRFLSYWIPRLCFVAAVAAALFLSVLVCLAPLLHDRIGIGFPWLHAVRLFATDVTLRRTSIASAVGLLVTAFVFFRVPGTPRRRAPERDVSSTQRMAGA